MREPPGLRRVVPVLLTIGALMLSGCAGRGGDTESGDVSNPAGRPVPVVVDPANCQDYQPSAGVTEDTIRIGGSYPDSGPLANIADGARGLAAYFETVNQQGGVNGRRIEFVGLDDQYDPTRTVANVNELLERQQVFAIAAVQSTVGTVAVWDRLARECIPMLASTMAAATQAQRMAHLNVMDAIVPYASEGYATASHASQAWGARNLGFIGQAGTYGDSYLRGIRASAAESGASVVGAETYQVTDPTVTAQITNLRASGADTLLIAAAGTKCAQILDAVASAGWRPRIVLPWICSSASTMELARPESTEGVVAGSVLRLVTPGDPESDRYLDGVTRFGDGVDPRSEGAILGWMQGQLIVEILSTAPALTRTDVINTALAQQDLALPMLQDGITANTSPTDNTPFESMEMRVYKSQTRAWRPVDNSEILDLTGVLAVTE